MVSGSILYVGGGSASIFKTGQGPTVAVSNEPTPTVVKDPKTLYGPTDPVLGNPNAKVTIVEFSDFQCPFCRQFFVDTFSQLKQKYIDTGKVRLIYRNFPLTQIHPAAQPAALAGECANDQGKFWQYHDKVFSEQQKRETNPAVVTKTITFGATELKAWASQIGLDMTQFNQCFDGGKHTADVQVDLQAGSAAGVGGTPSFFIDGQLLVGAQPFDQFSQLIDRELKK